MVKYGPFIADENDIKLYNFCKIRCNVFSKREMRLFFLKGTILVNGEQIRPNHMDEARRMKAGDVVVLFSDENTDVCIRDVEVLAETESFAVVMKPSGLSAAAGKTLEQQIKSKLWNREAVGTAKLVYYLEKRIPGLIIVAKDDFAFQQIRKQLSAKPPELWMCYVCVLCGFLGDAGTIAKLSEDASSTVLSTFTIRILRVVRCRFVNYLSLVEIVPTFEADHMIADPTNEADYSFIPYPSKRLKAMRCALKMVGHPIVGDGGIGNSCCKEDIFPKIFSASPISLVWYISVFN